MLFAFHLTDAPGSGALRAATRPAHKAHLAAVASRIALAGPLVDAAGTAIGSLLVIDFPDRAAALDWLAVEPFTRAGVYATSEVHAFHDLWPRGADVPPPAG